MWSLILLNITKHEHPWYYETISNVFSVDDFNRLKDFAERNNPHVNDRYVLPDEKWTDKRVKDAVSELADSLRQYFVENSSNFPNARAPKDEYLTAVELQYSPPSGFFYPVHDEIDLKSLSFVLYISPNDNVGTHLYLNRTDSKPTVTNEWKPNSAFIFAGVRGKTWHNFTSDSGTTRITLNIFLVPKGWLKIRPESKIFQNGFIMDEGKPLALTTAI